MTLAHSLLADFDREVALTRRTLEAVPEDRLTFRPHTKSWTLAELAGHIAETPNWATSMAEPEFDFLAIGDYRPEVPTSKAALLARFDENVAACRAAIESFDDDAMHATWTGRKGPRVLIAEPRGQIMRELFVHHWVQHRGQLQVYLRLCDAVVPPTYGPTADVDPWQ